MVLEKKTKNNNPGCHDANWHEAKKNNVEATLR